MSDPTVSCVIPTHGRPDFLREALKSVVSQEFPPSEIIVVSDDGNAESEDVVASFEGHGIPVRYLQNLDTPGASGSRNVGAKHASAELIAFLDDDDKWTPQFLSRAVEIMKATHTKLVVSWVEMFRGDRRADGVNITPGLTYRDAGSRTPGLTGSNFVMSKDAFDSIGGFDSSLRVLNDIDFMYRYLLTGGTYEVNTHRDLLQRRHDMGQLTKPTMMRADGVLQYIAKHRSTLRLSDVRHLKFIEHRTRYNAVDSRVRKILELLSAVIYVAPADVVESLANRRKRDIWH